MTIQAFINGLYNTVLIQNKEDKRYLIISLISTILNIVLSIILVVLMKNNKYMGRIIGSFISTLIIGILMYFKLSKGQFYIKSKLLGFAIKLSLPIVPHIAGHQILTSSDRIMLNTFIGSNSVGIYGFAYNIGMLVNIIWQSINNAWVPWYFENIRQKKYKNIDIAIKKYIIIFTIITVLMIFITPELGTILAPKEYWEGIKIVPLIILSYFFVFLYSFPVNIQFYQEKTKYIPIGTVSTAIINILLNLIFIPKYGLKAATISTLISYILLFIFHLGIVKYLFKYKDNNIVYYIVSSLVVSIFTILFYITIETLILRYSILLIIFIYLYNKRGKIKEILKRSLL